MNHEPDDTRSEGYRASRTALQEPEHRYEPMTETIVETIAEAADADPTQLEPLYESIDPDALDDLFDRRSDANVPARVTFHHEGFEVVVERDGRVEVRDPN
ncbi:HalOD1 output domain-containing protein [Haladaptatus salinisoli]|uniref:HalOD1 output domain-containing protein n=1 Tax=Haladaptatus salinisoli TaxID=2884876 RepID=UPI001D0ABD43|nr:HalOD1 output domain-containing protein [Haladaptatus salinisoli]